MLNKVGVLVFIGLVVQELPGCTTRALYEGVQATAKQACLREPPSEQERCESRLNKQDFDSYAKDQRR
jgi:hypothetical protein